MKKIILIALSASSFLWFQSCKNEKPTEVTTSNTSSDLTMHNADSLLALVNQEWKIYTDLDSSKFKDLKGVYFQLKNIPSTNPKMLTEMETATATLEKKQLSLDMPNFINEFFSYDSLLMIHVKDVLSNAQSVKGSENLAVLKTLDSSLLASVDDNRFVAIQSHLDLAIAIYNDYLKAHPEVVKASNGKHKPFPEFGTIDRSTLKPVL